MSKILVAGCNGTSIAEEIRTLLADERYPLFCSNSLRDMVASVVPEFDNSRWTSIVPLDRCFRAIEDCHESPGVIVLTSGDPLFYGIGKRLQTRFPDWQISYYPAVSYMQSSFARFGIHWDDASFLSLHGRPLESIDGALFSPKLFLFTDPENTPNRIAHHLKRRLSDGQQKSRRLYVAECIGLVTEKFSEGTIDEICTRTFRQPNSMIIVDQSFENDTKPQRFGLNESEIEHSRGLITKSEVRAAVIHRLRLPESGVFWDVGAGSGSISLEVSRLYDSLSVYAVERHEQQLANIGANLNCYRCRNLTIVSGEAPDVLAQLPSPDCVFVGGSGGRLEEILEYVAGVLNENGRIVLTAVLEKTAQRAPEILYRKGFTVDISRVQVTRSSYPEQNEKEFNPIQIIQAVRSPR